MKKQESSPPETKACEKGSALVLAVFVLVLLTGMGTALLFMSQNEMKMGRANLQTKQAFYLAEAGLEHGRLTLYNTNGNGPFGDDLIAHAGLVDTSLNFDPETVNPVFDADGNLTGLTGYGDDVPLTGLTAFGNANGVEGWFAAFLTNDPVEMQTVVPNTTDSDDRVMITGVGVGPGGSMEVVQAILEVEYRFPPIPPASITLLGPTPLFCSGTSNASDFTGDDCAGGFNVPVVGTVGPDAEASAEAGLYKGKKGKDGKFESGPDFHSGAEQYQDAFGDLTDPAHPMMTSSGQPTMAPEWQDCLFLHDMVEEMRADAFWVCTDSCTPPAGTKTNQILFVDQPTNFGITQSETGAGTLVVTGQLTIGGGASWDGLILAIGEGIVKRAGGGSGWVSGAVVVADIAGPDNVYGTADDCTGGPNNDGFGIAEYCVDGGGNGNTKFCSTNLADSNPADTYRIVEFLQH